MTVNLSNNPWARLFGADKPPKLNENYERMPEVENQIREILRLTESEFLARLKTDNFKSEQFINAETLVCLLSLSHAENQTRIADLIAERLARIGERGVRKYLRTGDWNENFIEEAVREVVFQMFRQILGREEKSYVFWEIRFYVALNRLIQSFVRKHGERYEKTKLFSEMSDAENEDEESDFESRLEKFESLALEEKLAVKKILGKMPAEYRKIFILYRADGWTQDEIAEVFGITTRTVRNRLRQAEEFLENFRGGKI